MSKYYRDVTEESSCEGLTLWLGSARNVILSVEKDLSSHMYETLTCTAPRSRSLQLRAAGSGTCGASVGRGERSLTPSRSGVPSGERHGVL